MIYAACTEYTRIADAHITPTFTRVVGYLNNDKLDNVESEIEELEEMAKTAGSEVEKEIKLIARKYEERQRTTKWELDKLSTDKRTAE
ncbi:unnamed protein product [Anisakis simplex]|uniref:Kinesin motor domain-containing protein n=1 Tax=Anisakis simplex TaxID=6269 RepID=A0A0M3JHN3_ANISI|nr:unnamed protein product [Anisakis simplex]